MKRHALTLLAFIAVTFAVQATSHFVINTGHYATIPFMRADVVFLLGFLAMIVQGVALSYLYARLPGSGRPAIDGLKFGLIAGSILASYIAFAEPAKYAAPSIPAWIVTEGLVSLTQFSVFGVLLGLIHGTRQEAKAAA